MEKKYIAIIIVFVIFFASFQVLYFANLFTNFLNSYSNDLGWIWISGNKTAGSISVYGTRGVPNIENHPGGRDGAISWIDSNDNLWLFGGHEGSLKNDLWKFDGLRWTWVSGSNSYNVYGIYGTKGVPNAANYPGSRRDAVSWIDSNDNLWLFGGDGYAESGNSGDLNDLWKFDGVSWTWVSGDKIIQVTGIYGTKGVPDTSNHPGCRSRAISWIDTENNLWLFGGIWDAAPSDWRHLNDLWKFDGVNWTWMSGTNSYDVYGIYGTKGVSDETNCPGSRMGAISWTDSNDNLWLLGGLGFAESGERAFVNDLWKFTSSNWTWMSGHKTSEIFGNYGIKGIPSTSNYPGSRAYGVSWIDSDNNLWLFGGYGFSASGFEAYRLNDLWRYDGTSWTWMSGSTTTGNFGEYGTKGIPGAGNCPGSRHDCVSWVDSNGNLWLFGGYGYSEYTTEWNGMLLNDLWKYDPDLRNIGM